MLKTFLLFAFARASSASQTTEQVKSSLSLIGDDLHALGAPGSARQVAMGALMKSLSSSEKLSPNDKLILNNVSSLLDDILGQLEAQANEDQDEIDGNDLTIANCNSAGVTEDAALLEGMNGAKDNHTECRKDEKPLFDAETGFCDTLETFLNNLKHPDQHPDCTGHSTTDTRYADDWHSLFVSAAMYFSSKKVIFETKRVPCESATDDLKEKRDECETIQNGYENKFCELQQHRTLMCSTRTTCVNDANDDHQNVTDAITPLSDERHREARLIKHVICLINLLVTDANLNDLENDCPWLALDAVELDKYHNNFTSGGAADPCDVDSVAVYPVAAPSAGHAEWWEFAYGWLDDTAWAGVVPVSTGITC